MDSSNFQFVFAYTDPFLKEFPELELYILEMFLRDEITNMFCKVYINIYEKPDINTLDNVSLDRDDVVWDNFGPNEYDIKKVYKKYTVASIGDYITELCTYNGDLFMIDVLVPVNDHNLDISIDNIIGQIVVLKKGGSSSSKKQIISVYGINDLSDWIHLLH